MELGKELQRKARNITVLYAEDEANLQKEVHEFLRHFFDHIELASNGEEGLEKFKAKPYDLIVTDIKMPKLNGLQMAKEIKKLDKNAKVIVTSAYDDKKLLLNAIEQSVDHYIVKPFDYSSFMVVLYKTVNLINLEKRIERLNRRKQAILDFQENIIFTFKEDKLTSANRKFLNFFQIPSIAEVNEGRLNPADFLVKENGFYYPGDTQKWAFEFQKNREYDLLVKMKDKKRDEARTFAMKVGFLDEFDETMITLTDISGYMESGMEAKNEKHDCLFFDQGNITQFFSFLQNEINRTKRYALPLSVIQFSFEGELSDEEIDKMDGVVMNELCAMDFLAKPTKRKFIIVKIDTEIAEANELSDRLYNALTKKFVKHEGFSCSFGVAGLDSHDSIQSMLSRAEGLQKSARESIGAKIKSDNYTAKTPGVLNQERDLIYNKLAERQRNGLTVDCILFYNGMKVVDKASIYHIDAKVEETAFKLSPKQYAILHADDKMFIEVDDYFAEVEGEIKTESMHDQVVTLKNLHFAGKSPLKREYVRISIDKKLPVKLDVDSKELNGKMIDLSIKSIAITVASVKNLVLGKVVNIRFALDVSGQKEEVIVRGEIYKIQLQDDGAFKVVLLLFSDRKVTHIITSYISHREKGIAHEMKAKHA